MIVVLALSLPDPIEQLLDLLPVVFPFADAGNSEILAPTPRSEDQGPRGVPQQADVRRPATSTGATKESPAPRKGSSAGIPRIA